MLIFLLAVLVAAAGVVQLLQGQIILGIVLLIVACLAGPSGYSVVRERRERAGA